ncbi:hypothetical protein SHIRM173S_07537 [Streptomyces hirsutus]
MVTGMPSAAAGERVASVVDAVRETFGGRAPATGEPVLPPGADSMTALALALALEDRLGVAVPPSLLRDGHDAAALAERLAGEHDTAAPGRRLTPAAGPAGLEPFSPTALQQAYLAGKEEELTPDAVGCHHYREFTVPDLDADRLRAAWSAVRQRHTMLRCALTPDGRLRIRPARDTAVPVHPAGHDPAEVRARLSRRRYTADDWPLHELEVTRLPDGDAVLHLAVDGLLCDGRALLVVMRDLWRAYEDSPEALTPEPDEVSFPAFAAAVAKEAAGERYAEDLRHWEARLADLPPGPGIVDPPARRDGDFGGGPDRLPLAGTLGAADWAALREVAARRGVTPTALLLSEFVAVLTDAGARLPFSLVLTTGDRARTRGAENTVGTFTSTLVFPVADTDAVAVQRCLAEDLDHATVPGVAALRRRRGPVPELPVVFTGMLDDERPPGGFPERYAVGRTSGVALDHQVWEANGTLHYRWDVVERAFPGPGARALFDAYGARLRALTGATEPVEQMEVEVERPLDDLQEAYLVARALGDEDVGGCRMLLGYEVEDLDVSRLRDAEARLIARHPVLRARVDAEHGLRLPSRTASVAAPEVPEVPLTPELREELLRQPFPLGVGHLDVRVGRGEDGPDVVLLTVDLALIDARSIHLVGRELMRLYAGGDDPGTAPPSRSAGTATALDPHEAGEHWRRRVAALSPGPRLPAAADDGTRRRLRGTLPGWDTVVAAAAEHGCTPDGLLLAAYARALSPGLGDVFTVPVVRWPDGTDAARPAELTALSWVTVTAEGCPLLDLARRYDAVLAEDRAADAIRGLTELRRSRRTDSSLPVVYTSLFDLDAHPLPDGVTAGAWVTSTPGVALDCVAVQEGGVLEYAWDALPEQLPADWLEDAFSRFAADLAGLASLAGTPADDPELPPSRWNDTTRPFPADLPVQILIEEQARLRPADVALRWSSGALFLAELELRANRSAWTRRAAGGGTRRRGGWGVAAARPGHGRRGPRHPEGRGRLSAGAAVPAPRPRGGDARRRGRRVPDQRRLLRLGGVGARRAAGRSGCGTRPSAPSGGDGARAGERRRRPGVRDLHLGQHRAAQGGGHHPPAGGNLFELARRTSEAREPAGQRRDAGQAGGRRGGEERGRGAGGRAAPEGPDLANWPEEGGRGDAGGPGEHRGEGGGQGRGGRGTGKRGEGEGGDEGQKSEGRGVVRCRSGRRANCTSPVSVSAVGYYRQPELTAERFVTGDFPELPRSARDPHVRDGRPGPLRRRRTAALPRPSGRAGQGARLPGGTPGDRTPVARACRGRGRGGAAADGFGRGGPAGGVCAAGRPAAHGGGVAGPCGGGAARLHGAGRGGVRDAVAGHCQRQAGPRRPAVAGPRSRRHPGGRAPGPTAASRTRRRRGADRPGGPARRGRRRGDRRALRGTARPAAGRPGCGPVGPRCHLVHHGAGGACPAGAVRAGRTGVGPAGRADGAGHRRADVRRGAARGGGGGSSGATPNGSSGWRGGGLAGGRAAAPEPVAEPPRVDFFAAEDRRRFKEGGHGQRPLSGPARPLSGDRPSEGQRRWRASRRPTAGRRLDGARLGDLLRVLARTGERAEDGALYPSAGDTYAVQVYVLVRDGAVDGLEAGAYYYRPRTHVLEPLGTGADVPVAAHVFYNRPFAARAAAEIYLVGETRGIEPLYGDQAPRYLALEAGHMAHC